MSRPFSRLRSSVFAKLLATMLAMAVVLVVLISGFFFFVMTPTVGRTIERLSEHGAELLAASEPDLESARRAAARLQLDIRREGPTGTWSTSVELPSIAAVERGDWNWLDRHSPLGRRFYVVHRPDGSAYLFGLRFHGQLQRAHDQLLVLLLLSVAAVVILAHAILRRALQPIRWLRDGFASLGNGNLEVTVERRTEDELGTLTDAFNEMVGRVRQMLKARDQLLLDVSHELRSPLTRMKVALALAGEDQQKARLLADVAEMEAMVTELLELERLREGRGLTLQPCDLTELVRAAAASHEDRPPGVTVGPLPPELTVEIDRDKIRMVLKNALENALKYSLTDSAPVRISVAQSAEMVTVRIDDEGPGIPESDLPHVFEPFFRVDRSRSRKTGGYGLGLSLCRRIMRAHGGEITAENRPGRGTSVVLRFARRG